MQTRTACPNCGHQLYIPMRITEEGGGLKLEARVNNPPAGTNPLKVIGERLDRLFKGAQGFEIEFVGQATILTPKGLRDKIKPIGGDQPEDCPDCGRKLPFRGPPIRSTKKLGFAQFVIVNESAEDSGFRAKMFPDGVEWAVEFLRDGLVLYLRSVINRGTMAPVAPTIGKGSTLDQIREEAVMEGIEGAEGMTAEQIATARAKLAKV